MEKKQNVPALRFPDFSGEWKERKISDIADVIGGGTPSTSEPAFWDGEIDWYAPAEMTGKRYADGSVRKITKLGLENSHATILPADKTILFTSRAGIGKVAILKKPAVTNQGFQSMVLQGNNNPYFLYSMGPKITQKAEKVASGSTFLEISGKGLGKISINLPIPLEQECIAHLFEKLDDFLENQEDKIKKLQQFRQAMLTKLFPREGTAEPELRFCGFSGKWHYCRFGDIASIRRGLTYSPSNLRKSGIRVLRSSNIQEDTFCVREDDVFVEPDAINIPMVKNGDILITAASGSTQLVGKHAVIDGIKGNTVVHGGFMLLASSDYPDFTNALMGASWYRRFIQQFVAGGNGAIGNLNKSDLEEQTVLIPDITEIKQIGNFFKELDRYIFLQQKKLERMRRLKMALLEKMFV